MPILIVEPGEGEAVSEDRQDLAAVLGHRVRDARAGLGLDQATTADLAGVSTRFLREVEHGKPTVRLSHLLAVLDAVGLRLEVVDDRV